MSENRKVTLGKKILIERAVYKRLVDIALQMEQKHLLDHSRLVYSQIIEKLLNKAKL